jgi:bifunctional UDP-N-acetylglucosamine pyrophosphorylase/glucosamine-1-phosphate N-acetyltransferase
MPPNIGAGPITHNDNGVAKHRATIGVGTSIGSDMALVAAATVGDGAIVAGGRSRSLDTRWQRGRQ